MNFKSEIITKLITFLFVLSFAIVSTIQQNSKFSTSESKKNHSLTSNFKDSSIQADFNLLELKFTDTEIKLNDANTNKIDYLSVIIPYKSALSHSYKYSNTRQNLQSYHFQRLLNLPPPFFC